LTSETAFAGPVALDVLRNKLVTERDLSTIVLSLEGGAAVKMFPDADRRAFDLGIVEAGVDRDLACDLVEILLNHLVDVGVGRDNGSEL
jgi:hypothetical protein